MKSKLSVVASLSVVAGMGLTTASSTYLHPKGSGLSITGRQEFHTSRMPIITLHGLAMLC